MTAAPPVAPMLRRDLAAWWASPPGRHLLQWERQRFDAAVANLFGYHALQLGLPELDALATNRMPHRWLALPEPLAAPPSAARATSGAPQHPAALVTHAAALPFAAQSLDLVLLPHTLELSADPHAVLREVERVLVPEGRVVIAGFNPASLWGLRQCTGQWAERWGLMPPESDHLFVPETGDWIAPWRLRDWLQLLGMQIESTQTGGYRWPAHTARWLERGAWLDRCGSRLWRLLGAVYFVVAVKRVRGMHLLGPAWKPRRALRMAPVAVARHTAPRTPEASQKNESP